jgi:hypothetical protein
MTYYIVYWTTLSVAKNVVKFDVIRTPISGANVIINCVKDDKKVAKKDDKKVAKKTTIVLIYNLY